MAYCLSVWFIVLALMVTPLKVIGCVKWTRTYKFYAYVQYMHLGIYVYMRSLLSTTSACFSVFHVWMGCCCTLRLWLFVLLMKCLVFCGLPTGKSPCLRRRGYFVRFSMCGWDVAIFFANVTTCDYMMHVSRCSCLEQTMLCVDVLFCLCCSVLWWIERNK